MKRILFDLNHPAHVHLFREAIKIFSKKGNEIFVTVKNEISIVDLLRKYNLEYNVIGIKRDSIISKGFNQIKYNLNVLRFVRKNKIDLGIGSSITLAHVSKLSKMKSIVFDDDDDLVEPLFAKFAHPFCDVLVSPDCLIGKRKKKTTIFYPGYHELAYLHPNRFKADIRILKDAGLKLEDRFFILRFNAFKAHHDVGVEGLSFEKKRKLVNILKKYGKIFITTEKEIDPEFSKYRLNISSDKIHSLMYYATMLIGDSQTMTSEAAVLGTPSIRSNSFVGRISYLEEEEHKYGLTYGFKPVDFDNMLAKIDELLKIPDLKKEWQKRRKKMLEDKIDITAFMVWFVENYPKSVEIMKKDPKYLERFK